MLTARTLALGLALALAAPAAFAQQSRTVHARMTFHAESRAMRTSACLRIDERQYPPTRWWENAGGGDGAERAFKAVIAAIRKKDRAAFQRLTDPSQTRDAAKLEQQANAFFRQFEVIQLLDVTRAFEFDDLVVFFGRFQSTDQTALVPMAFAYQGEDSFGFLPLRSPKVTFELVNDWFAPRSGDLPDGTLYCSDAEIARATHRVALVKAAFKPSALLLTGVPLDADAGAGPAKQVLARINQMKAALKSGNLDAFYQSMTVEGAGRLRQWMATASQAERDGYIAAFLQQEPFFVFDESPLFVVYVRVRAAEAATGRAGGTPVAAQAPSIQAIYFTTAPNGAPVWTNSSHVTTADKVFKERPLAAASAERPPFSSLVVK